MIQTNEKKKKWGNLENKNNKMWEILGQSSKSQVFSTSYFFMNSCSLSKSPLNTSGFQMFFFLCPPRLQFFSISFWRKTKLDGVGGILPFKQLNFLPTSLLSHVFRGQYRPSQVRHHTALQKQNSLQRKRKKLLAADILSLLWEKRR